MHEDDAIQPKDNSKLIVNAALEMVREAGNYPIKGSGISMKPFLSNEDTLIISSIENRKIRIGDILLYERHTGKYIIHRVYKINKDKTIAFIGDNQFQVEDGIREDQLRACVEKVIKNGKEIDCNKGLLRVLMIMYMRVRVRMPFIVRIFLAVYRRICNLGTRLSKRLAK